MQSNPKLDRLCNRYVCDLAVMQLPVESSAPELHRVGDANAETK